jgi:hypothetical protein
LASAHPGVHGGASTLAAARCSADEIHGWYLVSVFGVDQAA